jgi:hypothetical protein
VIKVYGGTTDRHLCETCSSSHIRTEGGQKIQACEAFPDGSDRVVRRVSQCSSYYQRTNAPALKLAWDVRFVSGRLQYMVPGECEWQTLAQEGED